MKKIIKIRIHIDKVSTGHKLHDQGCGKHHDKRLKRLKTRANQNKKAMEE